MIFSSKTPLLNGRVRGPTLFGEHSNPSKSLNQSKCTILLWDTFSESASAGAAGFRTWLVAYIWARKLKVCSTLLYCCVCGVMNGHARFHGIFNAGT